MHGALAEYCRYDWGRGLWVSKDFQIVSEEKEETESDVDLSEMENENCIAESEAILKLQGEPSFAESDWNKSLVSRKEKRALEVLSDFTEIVVRTCFNSKDDRNVQIFLKYLDGLTFDEIGKDYGLTRERIRQIVERMKKTVKHYKRSVTIAEMKFEKQYKSLQKKYQDLVHYHVEKKEPKKPPVDFLLSEEDLSVRLKNILRNENINTLGDLANCSVMDLLKLRSFGEKCLRETKDLLKKYGPELKKN